MSWKIISQLEFEADAINLKVIRNNLRHIFMEFNIDKKVADDMVIALNEACMNIIQHAYGDETEGAHSEGAVGRKKILIIIKKSSQDWQFELIDFAPPVDIESIKSRDLDDIRPGGLGVSFIRQIMDSVRYENIDPIDDGKDKSGHQLGHQAGHKEQTGNRLTLIKKIV